MLRRGGSRLLLWLLAAGSQAAGALQQGEAAAAAGRCGPGRCRCSLRSFNSISADLFIEPCRVSEVGSYRLI